MSRQAGFGLASAPALHRRKRPGRRDAKPRDPADADIRVRLAGMRSRWTVAVCPIQNEFAARNPSTSSNSSPKRGL